MAYSFAVYDHILKVAPLWHQLTASSSSMNASNVGVQDRAAVDHLKSYYLIASENERPVFLMYFQLLSVKPGHFNLGNKKLLQSALSTALRLVKPTLLVAGNLFRHDVFFLNFIDPATASLQKAVLFQEAINHMIKLTNASGIFLKDVPAEIATEIKKDNSYTAFENDISMEISIPAHWQSFGDYEKELKHKYYQRCRKVRKAFGAIQVRDLEQADLDQYGEELFALYLQVTQKQMVSMGMINAAFIQNLKKTLQQSYRVCGFFLEGKLVAFSSAILHDDQYDMNYIGIDYRYNQTHHLYFNILFHCLESAILLKSKKLILGRTAPEAKAIVGCTPDYRFSFYKLRNAIVNWFFQRVSRSFSQQQGENWKTRHPFKSNFYKADPK